MTTNYLREQSAVSHHAMFTLLDPSNPGRSGLRVKVELFWSSWHPYAVTLSFAVRSGRVDWIVSRDLLAAGLDGPVGVGDVAVLPDFRDRRRVELILDSPSGRVGFRVRRAVLAGFLAATSGHESVEVTAELDEWVREVTA